MSARGERKELLYVWPYLEWGGAQIYFTGIMKLACESYSVRAVMPKGTGQKLIGYLGRLNVTCEYFDAHLDLSPAQTPLQKIRRRWRNAACELSLARYLTARGLKGRLVHIDVGPWTSFLLLSYLALRSEVFVTLHIGLPRVASWRRWLWRLKFASLSRMSNFHLLVSNQDMLESLRPYAPKKLLQRTSVAYTAVDASEIRQALHAQVDRASLCAKYNLPPDRLLVFSLGQVIERKGCLVLLEAIRQLKPEHPALFFVWVGSGALEQDVARKVVEGELQDSFRLIRPTEVGDERADLLALLSMADIFVLPSFSEGLPGAMLEAMALGKACVASRVNAVPEAVKDHETGLLVEPGDSAALAAAIAELESDAGLRRQLASAGQAFVLENFNERRTAQITIEQYNGAN